MNKSSMLKKGPRTNLDVALSVVQLKSTYQKPRRRRLLWPSRTRDVPSCLRYLRKRNHGSNRLRIDLFIAVNAMYHQHVTTFKLINVETFPGLQEGLGGFLVVTRRQSMTY